MAGLIPLIVLLGASSWAHAMSPAYLDEMPSVERVKNEVRGPDARETALRQKGAFWQLQEIIRTRAGNRDPDQLTTDERKLMQTYFKASEDVSKAFEATLPNEDERQRFRFRTPYNYYRGHPAFGVDGTDLFKRFFSREFTTAFLQAAGQDAARLNAIYQKQIEDYNTTQAQIKADKEQQASEGAEEREIARCMASGRPELECITDTVGKAFGELLGVVNPSLNPETPFGLRLNGTFAGSGGLSIGFSSSFAAVDCNDVRRDDQYTIAMQGNQLLLTVKNEPKAYALTYGANGALTGSGTVSITGSTQVGTRTFTDGTSQPIMGMATKTCTLGAMQMTGPGPAGKASDIVRSLTPGEKGAAPPTGLRMNGLFAAASGFNVQFDVSNAVVACGQLGVAQKYTVSRNANQILVRIAHSPNPIVLEMRADGALAGTGPVQIDSRVLTGVTSDSANPVTYQPRSASCNMGVMVATKGPPSGAALGAAAAREAYGMPAPAKPAAPAPATPTATGGNVAATAALTITTGAGTPLAGQNLFLLRDSFGTALTKGGFKPPAGMTPVKAWAAACLGSQPSCQQAANAASQNAIALTQVDGSGRAQFPAVPPGTYHVFAAALHNKQLVMWNRRVILKAGANATTLELANTSPIE